MAEEEQVRAPDAEMRRVAVLARDVRQKRQRPVLQRAEVGAREKRAGATREVHRMCAVRELYTQHLDARRAEADVLRGRERRTSIVRLLLIAAAVGLAFWSVSAALVPVALFVVLVVMHERIIRARKRAESGAACLTSTSAQTDSGTSRRRMSAWTASARPSIRP